MNKRWFLWLLVLPLFYRPIFALFLIFFLPGSGFVFYFLKKSDMYEKISLSIALSIILAILNGFFLNLEYGLSIAPIIFNLLLLFIIPLVINLKKNGLPGIELDFDPLKVGQNIFLVLCLGLLALSIYQPHFDNPYPLHDDEWGRLIETTYIMETGKYGQNINPQLLGNPPSATLIRNPGYQMILSQFFIVAGVEPVSFFPYMAAMFAMLTGFILFAFLNRIAGYWSGVFGITFLSLLKTNDNILGIHFLVALTMTFPLLYAMFYSLHNAFDKKKSIYLIFASLIYLSILTIHEQTGAAFFPILILYFLVAGIRYLKRNWGKIEISRTFIVIGLVSFILPLLSIYFARNFLWEGSLSMTIQGIINKIVWQSTGQIEHSYNLVIFYGVGLTALALLGLIMLTRNWNFNVFVVWSLVGILQIVNFYFNHVTYFAFIERIRYHTLLGLIPLSAQGLFELINTYFKLFDKLKKVLFPVFAIMIISLLFSVSFAINEGGEKDELSIRPVISYEDYIGLMFLKNISQKNVVMTNPEIATTIYPSTKNYIVSSIGSFYDGGDVTGNVLFFTTTSCDVRDNIAEKNSVKYVLSSKPFKCPMFNKIYSKYDRYIYEFSKSISE